MKQENLKTFGCPHFSHCSGCTQQLTEPPVIWSEVLDFLSPYSCDPQLKQGRPIHWRYRAKVAVRGSSLNPSIGLFQMGTHDVYPIPLCLVHHPRINKAFEIVRQWIITNHIEPYQEKTKTGSLRYLQAVVQRETGKIQLTLVINQKKPTVQSMASWQQLVLQLVQKAPDLWHSLWINWNTQSTNTIFDKEWTFIYGEEYLWEQFQGVDVCYHPASFGQANLDLFEQMLERIQEILTPQSRLVEFYAGVGVIGLSLLSFCEWVKCIEINPLALHCFHQSKNRLNQELATKISYLSAATHKTLAALNEATSVIVDPPRKGLDASFFQALLPAENIKQLIYISCGWIAFQRDFKQLLEQGWKIELIEGYVFFPGSSHIEILAHFSRK